MQQATYTSVTGATVFWGYIVAALTFVSICINAIRTNKVVRRDSSSTINLFVILAFISFTTLSFHMLNVLALSYRQWSYKYSVPLPSCIFGPGCLLGNGATTLHLWQWSKTSTLFQDFGEALVETPGRWCWSNAALALTYINVTFICSKGRQARTPNLWAFVALAEILPISVAQNLFYLALLASNSIKKSVTLGSGWMWLFSGLGYIFCLLVAPNAGRSLISVILVARLLLALPIVMPVYSTDRNTAATAALPKASLFIFGVLALVSVVPVAWALQVQNLAAITKDLNNHPAVSALGYDFIISCLSWALWFAAGTGNGTAVKYGPKDN